MKRVVLFLLTNLAVMLVLGVVLSIVFSVLGISSRSMGDPHHRRCVWFWWLLYLIVDV